MRVVLLNILLCSVILVQNSEAQHGSIRGTIISAVDSLPIEECIVALTWSHLISSSDSLGRYRIDSIPFSQYHLTILGPGYITVDTEIKICYPEPIIIDRILKVDHDTLHAEKDIKHQIPKLFLAGGIVPIVYSDDTLFENKFKIRYYDFGDTPPADAIIRKYNRTIFNYLDYKYGTEWRSFVRKDVLFLK
ncbi:MAG TPA: hypothetical protein VMU30_02775 [Bacteroidota bacterium]|nr:hypothetical protein [Bacteroidota bacterium]